MLPVGRDAVESWSTQRAAIAAEPAANGTPRPAAAEPKFGDSAAIEGIKFILPDNPRAGFGQIVEITSTLPDDAEITVTWPDISFDGTAFVDAVLQLGPRKWLITWPVGGKYPLQARALVLVKRSVKQTVTVQVDGQPHKVDVDVEQVVGIREVVASAILALGGGAVIPDDEPLIPIPPAQLSSLVAPVTAALAGKPAEAGELKRLYSAIALAFERGACQTTDAARALHINTAKYTIYGALAGKVPGLAEKIDSVLIASIGTDSKAIDAATRANLVATFRALAWACQEVR